MFDALVVVLDRFDEIVVAVVAAAAVVIDCVVVAARQQEASRSSNLEVSCVHCICYQEPVMALAQSWEQRCI